MIDAYAHRKRLTAPKLIVLWTNGGYTPADALNVYWSGLVGRKGVLYLMHVFHRRRHVVAASLK